LVTAKHKRKDGISYTMKKTETIFNYHEETKHHQHRYARSLGYMDWANQPNPFRLFEDASRITLPLSSSDSVEEAKTLFSKKSVSGSLSLGSLAYFLELSMGLSAWKGAGADKWALRMNPSSGNLHPTEAYVILPSLGGYPAGIYHYSPYLHALELLMPFSDEDGAKFDVKEGFAVILTTIVWREAWKYGERCFRYCNHDVGHALGSMVSSANLEGWGVTQMNIEDSFLEKILGFDMLSFVENEEEITETLLWIGEDKKQESITQTLQSLTLTGLTNRVNTLSQRHDDWPILKSIAQACHNESSHEMVTKMSKISELTSQKSATKVIRKRRSAQSFNSCAPAMSKDKFEAILSTTIENNYFNLSSNLEATHLFIFVHNVQDVESGLYALIRNDADLESLKSSMKEVMLWQKVESKLPLYFLAGGDVRAIAKRISCNQDIAADSHFSLGMIVKFKSSIERNPSAYKHLFWESGLIGQALYLSAEACGYQGTGIGCFLDDEMHDLLGLEDNTWQDIYHFTVGEAVVDLRLQTLDAYHHLSQ
jgi:SagB-type dehydrogenase family enzyme